MQPIWPAAPALSAEKQEYVDTEAMPSGPNTMPSWADVTRGPMQGSRRRLQGHAPVWYAGEGGSEFVPGLVRKHVEFWDGVVLYDHSLRETLVSYFRDGVSVHKFLIASHRGPSVDLSRKADRFAGALFTNRIPPAHADFADAGMHSLIARGCVVNWEDVRSRAGPARPRLI